MSYVWMRPAYSTRLGNLTAKSVLVLLADQANGDGFCYPSIDFMAYETEINKRTIRRVIQVFIELGMVSRVDRGRKSTPGIQLNGNLLGKDLRGLYADRFQLAQGKSSNSRSGLRDTEEKVSETLRPVLKTAEVVSETTQTVSETVPPHPHIGRPAIDPLKTHPSSPQSLCLKKVTEEAAKIELALGAVMHGCAFTSSRLAPILRSVIQHEADSGVEPTSAALAMIGAWQNYVAQGARLRYRWTAQRFFGEGYWSKPDSWPWDSEVLERERQARVGRAPELFH